MPVSMMLPPKVRRSTMAAQRRGVCEGHGPAAEPATRPVPRQGDSARRRREDSLALATPHAELLGHAADTMQRDRAGRRQRGVAAPPALGLDTMPGESQLLGDSGSTIVVADLPGRHSTQHVESVDVAHEERHLTCRGEDAVDGLRTPTACRATAARVGWSILPISASALTDRHPESQIPCRGSTSTRR